MRDTTQPPPLSLSLSKKNTKGLDYAHDDGVLVYRCCFCLFLFLFCCPCVFLLVFVFCVRYSLSRNEPMGQQQQKKKKGRKNFLFISRDVFRTTWNMPSKKKKKKRLGLNVYIFLNYTIEHLPPPLPCFDGAGKKKKKPGGKCCFTRLPFRLLHLPPSSSYIPPPPFFFLPCLGLLKTCQEHTIP